MNRIHHPHRHALRSAALTLTLALMLGCGLARAQSPAAPAPSNAGTFGSIDPALHARFWQALEAQDATAVAALLQATPGLARSEKDKTPALHAVATVELARLLLAAGADINAQKWGYSALTEFAKAGAAETGKRAVALHLVQAGASLRNTDTIMGFGPLVNAARFGNVELVKAMLAAGAEPNGEAPKGKYGALHWAYSPAVVEALLVGGADVSRPGINGATPLGLAAERGSLEVVKLLVQHGARLNVKEPSGDYPLDIAQRTQANPKNPPAFAQRIGEVVAFMREQRAPETPRQTAVAAESNQPSSGGGGATMRGLVRQVYFYLALSKEPLQPTELFDHNKRSLGKISLKYYYLWHCAVDGPPELERKVVFEICERKMAGHEYKAWRRIGSGVYTDRGGVDMVGTVFKALGVEFTDALDDWGRRMRDHVDIFSLGQEVVLRLK